MTALDEEQLGQLLANRLHEETYAMTAPSGLTETLHRKNNRRTWGLRIAGAVPVVAAVALAASLTLSPDTSTPSTNAGGTGTSAAPEMLTVSFVAERAGAALGDLSNYVQHERASHEGRDGKPASTIEYWGDPKSDRTRQDMVLFFGDKNDYTTTVNGSAGAQFDHLKKKWWTFEVSKLTAVDSTNIQSLPPQLNPTELKAALDNGKLKLIGKESVDGKATVHLQWLGGPESAMDKAKAREESMEIWVDSESYLPVRVISKVFTGITTSNYEWLPRNADNLAKLDVTAPADYKKLACMPTPGDDCGLND
ncbi:hypothetical protein ACI2K4_13340 [Micromonospora sp. NPDC050397]|uniref:hypothetical protein n=1 Tax=Micromonospora sp. NPDC050397 TaxID=3364279 RepID=UPI00384FD979